MPKKKKEINKNQALHLKLLLKEQRISQKQLAERISISPVVVSHWVNSVANIPADRIAQIVQIYSSNDYMYSREWLEGKTEFRSNEDEKLMNEYRNETRRMIQLESAMGIIRTVSHYNQPYFERTIFEDGSSVDELSLGDDITEIPKYYEYYDLPENIVIRFTANEMRKIAFEIYQIAKTKLDVEITYKKKEG